MPRVPLAPFAAAALLGGCGAIVGVDKYDVNDCPNGDCFKSEAGATGDAAVADDAAADADANADAGADVGPACPSGTALVTLTVLGAGSVSSTPPGLTVTAPNTASACLPLGTVVLQSSGGNGAWVGVTCKDGNGSTDVCEFQNTAGATVTVTLKSN